MNVFRYTTLSGKDLILDYINKLPNKERILCKKALAKIEEEGLEALKILNTRQLRGKLWEIKVTQNRFMYVVADENNLYILHACKKQKGKAEQFELQKAIKRVKELEKEIDKKFI